MELSENITIDHLGSSPIEIIRRIYNKVDWVSHVDNKLQYREYVCPVDANESLDDLICLYTNKKSKRVGYAGKKLKKIFLDLPCVEQRKVGLALLSGGLTDSEWVCKRLDNYKESFDKEWKINWHPCYEKAVEECWNKYHGMYCGKLLIQFLPEDIVRKHIDELTTDKDFYFYLSRRFVNTSWFKLDIEKLKSCTYINAYLSVMIKTNDGISEEEARLLLYQWIAYIAVTYAKGTNAHTNENIFYSYKSKRMRVINAWGLDTALYYLLCMNHHKVVAEFLEWDNNIFNQFYDVYRDSELGTTEIVCEDFTDTIIDNFPSDLRYLLSLNEEYYLYILTPGQPFTIPRFRNTGSNKKEEDIPKYIPRSNVKENNTIVYSSQKTISKDSYERMVDSNPTLKNLIEQLNLSPTNLNEERRE
ncbi:hypothetical protein [Parabacteroides sp. ZJ-118]|uniref:hypothetical protein n=1 Tax=Parabacteroides sp. ZJ-118 TaxID=2709398 RepID=UPI0013EDD2CB|nr:hypothetical protein [Parabacteroides sp. ZJ-118]